MDPLHNILRRFLKLNVGASRDNSSIGGVRRSDADDVYLAGAADLSDLERRMRIVERGSRGPFYVTFNH